MKRVFLCSPYSGDTKGNVLYARLCMRDSLAHGEAPFAPHLLYTQPHILDDNLPVEREQGISAGLAFIVCVDLVVVYMDLGISPGMDREIKHAISCGISIEYRKLVKRE